MTHSEAYQRGYSAGLERALVMTGAQIQSALQMGIRSGPLEMLRNRLMTELEKTSPAIKQEVPEQIGGEPV